MERKEFYGGTGKEKKNRRTGGTTSNRHTGSSHRTGQTSRKKSPDQRRNFAVIHPHFLFRQRNPPSVHFDSGRKIEISRRLFSGNEFSCSFAGKTGGKSKTGNISTNAGNRFSEGFLRPERQKRRTGLRPEPGGKQQTTGRSCSTNAG